ncbi:NADH dehydrogenase (ubiquinone) 1 beta subcomplex subunit 11 [Paragonimus westermani]|uniref:NADH dehydrogenase [ubiquinone] 1 beta subcomplex subunit 11, mitochondrial n=1 Tax=Paragonimus westermani TaxID=34504 RepID=A0A5J4NZY4_9TREM|nr:NADH dehydrogenase (ubiquinone) 1 beta subcomplex subunit 11 [Paragonimus westermani]
MSGGARLLNLCRKFFNGNTVLSGIRLNLQRDISILSPMRSEDMPSMPHVLKENQIPEADRRRIEEEDWVPLGFHRSDKNEDLYRYNLIMFFTFSFFTCGIFMMLWYLPNRCDADWSRREAFLELERRRRDGLPLIDRNLIPPELVKLPTDEELGPDFKIVI